MDNFREEKDKLINAYISGDLEGIENGHATLQSSIDNTKSENDRTSQSVTEGGSDGNPSQ